MKCLLLITITLIVAFASSRSYGSDDAYQSIPTARQRAGSQSNVYTVIKSFEPIEIIKETDGSVDTVLLQKISDGDLKTTLTNGTYKALTIHDLAIMKNQAFLEDDVFHIPFALTVNFIRSASNWYRNTNAGVEVGGEFLILQGEDGGLKVTVKNFYDSKMLDHGARWFGANKEVDLNFTRKLVVPELESYFNEDPERTTELLKMVSKAPELVPES